MRRYHSSVGRVELLRPSPTRELPRDLVDSLGYYQRRTVDGLGKEISQRAIETARQHNALTILRHQGKGSVDAENCVCITSEQPAPSLRFVDRPEPLRLY
jgi:hypothetical protein